MMPIFVFLLVSTIVLDVHTFTTDGNEDPCAPHQVHLSYGSVTTEITIVWSTVSQCPSTVFFGVDPWNLNQSASGQSIAFDVNKGGMKVLHNVLLKDLLPGTTYHYLPNSKRNTAYRFFFKTPSNKELQEARFLIVGELNNSTSADSFEFLISEAQTGTYAAFLHTGNIAVNLSTDNGKNGDEYMRKMEAAVATVPYLVAPGPSEVEDNTFTQYLHRFSMPSTKWPMNVNQMWYSLDIGLVHLISYSSEVFYLKDGQYEPLQRDWLIKDLQAASKNRQNVPWIVAFGNRPIYCTYEDPDLVCNKKISKIKTGLEDIFFHYGVDLVIQSYGGAYERTFPMFKDVAIATNYTNPNGPVHIISGSGSLFDLEFNFTQPAPDWSAFRITNESVRTVGRLHVVNSSILEYEQVDVKDNTVLDCFMIKQEHHGQFSLQNMSSSIVAEVNKNIVDAGGKPGTLNIGGAKGTSSSDELLNDDNKMRIIIGGICAGAAFVLVGVFILAKLCKKKTKVTRRWEQMDINYGKKFYNKAPEKDEDNDFEIDMSDGTEPTRKLLNSNE